MENNGDRGEARDESIAQKMNHGQQHWIATN